ncbi:lysylphosphatidylglycerol synthase transmembrane domain-containing protein [Actinomadura scrupuli]|uniref:lysylphosphatidylglycerol synthase transmembrane domain-containing protein n=1 Tax=Actinomadura scrupuli TaxID=559629 RepID=UPI003D97A0F2
MIRALWPRLRVLAGAGILAALVWRLGTDAFVNGLRMIDGRALLAALAIGLLTTVFSAWRWCLVARGLGLRLPLPTAVADYYRALLLNAVLPTGVLGDVHRAVSHGRDAGDVGRGVRAVALERIAGQVVLLAVGVPVLLTQSALVSEVTHALVPGRGVVYAALGGLAVLTAVVLVLAGRGRWRPGTTRWRRALATASADARLGLLSRGTWPGVVLLSAAALLGHVALFVVAARVAGSPAPIVRLVPLMVLALLVMGLPVNVGGWGPREAVSALAFGAAGLGASQGLTAAVVYGILTLVASLPGAGVLIFRYSGRKVRLPRPAAVSKRRFGRGMEPIRAESVTS